ncbi:MAG: hypothetical protein P8Y58_14860 [Novosphingobium sp.]
MDPELGRLSLHAADEGKAIETGFAHATPFDIGGGAYDRRTSLEKWLPDFVIAGEPPVWQIGVSKIDGTATDDPLQGGPVVTTMREAVRRWNDLATEGSRGIITVLDNASYVEKLNGARRILLPKGSCLAIVAAAWPVSEEGGGVKRRPRGQLSPMHRRPVLLGPMVIDAADAGQERAGSLVIDGLVIGDTISARPGGDLGALRLYNCTTGPTGPELKRGIICTGGNTRLSLVLDRCITAKVNLPHATGTIEVTRSIIGEDLTADTGGTGATIMVLRVPQMDMTIAGTTLIGRAACRTIRAENSILTGIVKAEYRLTGCVRFCYVKAGSVLPRRYRCVPLVDDDPEPRPVFVSTRFQVQGFGQLNLCTQVSHVR